MSTKDIVKKLKQLRIKEINPRPEWVSDQRTLLLSQIKNTIAPETTPVMGRAFSLVNIFLPESFVRTFGRPVMAGVAAIIMILTGYATVDAASNALPDDQFLYPVKRTVEALEKTTVAITAKVTGDTHAPTELSLKFAGKRADEVKRLVANDDASKTAHAVNAVNEL